MEQNTELLPVGTFPVIMCFDCRAPDFYMELAV